MLTLEEKGRPIASRVKGKAALVKRLRGLLLATHRYSKARARASDYRWTGCFLDALNVALQIGESHDGRVFHARRTDYEDHGEILCDAPLPTERAGDTAPRSDSRVSVRVLESSGFGPCARPRRAGGR
jgi:hypothetical protein